MDTFSEREENKMEKNVYLIVFDSGISKYILFDNLLVPFIVFNNSIAKDIFLTVFLLPLLSSIIVFPKYLL